MLRSFLVRAELTRYHRDHDGDDVDDQGSDRDESLVLLVQPSGPGDDDHRGYCDGERSDDEDESVDLLLKRSRSMRFGLAGKLGNAAADERSL